MTVSISYPDTVSCSPYIHTSRQAKLSKQGEIQKSTAQRERERDRPSHHPSGDEQIHTICSLLLVKVRALSVQTMTLLKPLAHRQKCVCTCVHVRARAVCVGVSVNECVRASGREKHIACTRSQETNQNVHRHTHTLTHLYTTHTLTCTHIHIHTHINHPLRSGTCRQHRTHPIKVPAAVPLA